MFCLFFRMLMILVMICYDYDGAGVLENLFYVVFVVARVHAQVFNLCCVFFACGLLIYLVRQLFVLRKEGRKKEKKKIRCMVGIGWNFILITYYRKAAFQNYVSSICIHDSWVIAGFWWWLLICGWMCCRFHENIAILLDL